MDECVINFQMGYRYNKQIKTREHGVVVANLLDYRKQKHGSQRHYLLLYAVDTKAEQYMIVCVLL